MYILLFKEKVEGQVIDVFELQACEAFKQLLPLILPVNILDKTQFFINLNGNKPWEWVESLEKWLQCIEDYILECTLEQNHVFEELKLNCKLFMNSVTLVIEAWKYFSKRFYDLPNDVKDVTLEQEALMHNIGVSITVLITNVIKQFNE